MLRINVNLVTATVQETEVLTSGRVGLQCEFSFSEEWDGLQKTATFEGAESADVAMFDSNVVTVPHECMSSPGAKLRVGVCGMNANGDIVIPTIWANAGRIQQGAEPSGIPAEEPTPNWAAQVQAAAASALEIARGVKNEADSGEFDGEDGTSPTATVSKTGTVTTITITDKNGTTTASVNDGTQGVQGESGQKGETGNSGVYYGTSTPTDPAVNVWIDPSGTVNVPEAATATPQALGTAAVGTSAKYAREDHVHAKPTPSDIGALSVPVSANDDDVLTYDDGAWVAKAPSGGGGSVSPYTSNPAALGTASPGSSDNYSRGDHVHENNQIWATYGTTTAAEVKAAYDAGKEVLCKYTVNGAALVHRLMMKNSDTSWIFFGYYSQRMYSIRVDNSTWSNTYNEFVSTGSASTSNPSALGTASPGSSQYWSKGDHVHPMPSASDVGAAPAITEVTVSTAGAVSQALDPGKLYHFTGALTALTITLNAASAGVIPQYYFDFDCGSTAPTVTIPNTVTMPDGNTFAASKHYEVDILNNYGVVQSWATS